MDDMTELEWVYRNLKVLRWECFQLIYGSNVYKYWAPDNTPMLACLYRDTPVNPYVKPTNERIERPRPKDKVKIIEDGVISYGHIIFIDREDDCFRLFNYRTKSVDTWSVDLLETNRDGREPWRIIL
jgi:hypothetical protein